MPRGERTLKIYWLEYKLLSGPPQCMGYYTNEKVAMIIVDSLFYGDTGCKVTIHIGTRKTFFRHDRAFAKFAKRRDYRNVIEARKIARPGPTVVTFVTHDGMHR